MSDLPDSHQSDGPMFAQRPTIRRHMRCSLQLGYRRRLEVIAPNLTAMVAMVMGTDRIATMHHRRAAIFARNFPLKLLRAPIRIPAFRETLQWPASFHMDPALAWLREIITVVASELDRTPVARMRVG